MSKLTQYIMALTNLYGMVHKEMVLSIYNRMNTQKMSIDRINSYFDSELEQIPDKNFNTYDQYFYHEIIGHPEDFVKFIREVERRPFYIPNEQELLKHVGDFYNEQTEAYHRLHEYAYEHIYSRDLEGTSYFTETIMTGLIFGLSVEAIMSVEFHRMEVEIKDEMQREELFRLIKDLSLDIRTWTNKGYTERELSEINQQFNGSLGEQKKSKVIEFWVERVREK